MQPFDEIHRLAHLCSLSSPSTPPCTVLPTQRQQCGQEVAAHLEDLVARLVGKLAPHCQLNAAVAVIAQDDSAFLQPTGKECKQREGCDCVNLQTLP